MTFSPLDLILFLLGMGFTEVIVKPLAMTFFRKTFSLLPRVFDKLDPIMPSAIAKMSPAELERNIFKAIEGSAEEEGVSLNEAQKKELFDEFLRLYNPVTAASKVEG